MVVQRARCWCWAAELLRLLAPLMQWRHGCCCCRSSARCGRHRCADSIPRVKLPFQQLLLLNGLEPHQEDVCVCKGLWFTECTLPASAFTETRRPFIAPWAAPAASAVVRRVCARE